jgi:predicted GNAT superfamily acetyltransferase
MYERRYTQFMNNTPPTNGITICLVTTPAEVEEFQAVERRVWEGSDLEIVPAHVLLTHRRYGGMLLIARDGAGHGIGVLLGFPGLKDGRTLHCSHLLGVVPEWRSHDVGYRMKCRQRELVLEQGLDLVVWTFDPLETRNARLNIGRLGGICREYTPNLYGVMRDGLNAGLETDRLTVEWHIGHPAVEARLAGRAEPQHVVALLDAGVPLLTRTTLRRGGETNRPLLYLEDVVRGATADRMLVEAPADFQAIKRVDFEAAHAWRLGIRALMQDLFARGYAALDMLLERHEDGSRRCYYLIGHADRYLAGND